jgi:hypothetical protein
MVTVKDIMKAALVMATENPGCTFIYQESLVNDVPELTTFLPN